MTTIGEVLERHQELAANRIGAEHDYRERIRSRAEQLATSSRRLPLDRIDEQVELKTVLERIEAAEKDLDMAMSALHKVVLDRSTEVTVKEYLDKVLAVLKETTNYYE